MSAVLEASGLGKKYVLSWALRDCNLTIPAGHVTALVGPNGAGKSTLLHLAVGLCSPSAGQVQVLGGLRPGSPSALAGIGFMAQDAPLYRHLSVGEMLRLARDLNQRFDGPGALARAERLGLPAHKKVGALSGGQQAQLALTIALAKKPELLILDEPLARLDPLARHDFMGVLMAAVAEDGLSVIFSSHVIAELERVADYLVVLNRGRVQVCGAVDQLLASHRVLTGPADLAAARQDELSPVRTAVAGIQAQLLCRLADPAAPPPAGFTATAVTLEELVLAYLREPSAVALPGPVAAA